ncbi:hypothetical protein NC651_012076 [Populus alba x Populus x berolinensis]|nr:hypothetical protein NC651_012076 [Populus alba x Populus x berolinensis]
MVSLQFGYAGMYIIDHGFSETWALRSLHTSSVPLRSCYRLLIAPFAFVLERSLFLRRALAHRNHISNSLTFNFPQLPIVIYIFPSLLGREKKGRR